MKILNTRDFSGVQVETDGEPWGSYIRYGPDVWMVQMGESDEPLYDCEELERLFQKYKELQRQLREVKEQDESKVKVTIYKWRV